MTTTDDTPELITLDWSKLDYRNQGPEYLAKYGGYEYMVTHWYNGARRTDWYLMVNREGHPLVVQRSYSTLREAKAMARYDATKKELGL